MTNDIFFEELEKVKKAYSNTDTYKFNKFYSNNSKKFSNDFSNNSSKQSSKKREQVLVKNINNLNKKGTANCIAYILKNSPNSLGLNQDGECVSKKEILKDWQKDFGNKEKSKESWHLVFSIKDGSFSDIKKLEDSVSEVMKNNFFEYKYVMVTHTHQNNPHIHVVINKTNTFTRKKLHFNSKEDIKNFYTRIRNDFALSLNARGLNYENNNKLNKNLKEVYKVNKLQEENTKDFVLQSYINIKDNFTKKADVKKQRLDILSDEISKMNKEYFEMANQIGDLKKNKKKKFYQVAKAMKKLNKEIKEKRKQFNKEYNELLTLNKKITQTNERYFENYASNISSLNLKKNFIKSYEKLYPNQKGASKADFEKYIFIKKSIYEEEKRLNNELSQVLKGLDRKFFDKFFDKNQSIFILKKQVLMIENSIHIIKIQNIKEDLLTTLQSNKEFINDLLEKRFNFIEEKLSKQKKLDEKSFLYKEYLEGLKILNKENKFKTNSQQKIQTNTQERDYNYEYCKTPNQGRGF